MVQHKFLQYSLDGLIDIIEFALCRGTGVTLSKGNESVDVEVLVDDLSDLIANRTS